MKLDHSLTPSIKINSNWLKTRVAVLKQQEERKDGQQAPGHQSWRWFFGSNPQRKVNKWDCIKLNSFCTAKETINKMKRQPTEWEKISSDHISAGWYPNCIKNSYNSKEKKQIIQVKTDNLNRLMAKRHEKTFNITLIVREMRIKTTTRPHCHILVRMVIIKKTGQASVAEDTENPVHCWWEHKSVQLLRKPLWRFLKN